MRVLRVWRFIALLTALCDLRQVIAAEKTITASLAQAQGNPGDKSTEFQSNKGYSNSGCYKDTDARSVPSLEGSDPDLTGFYKQRQEPIAKCAAVARSRGYQLFAIQNGGMCLSGPKAQETYKIHGQAKNCKDGKGGEWANDVYIFNDFPLQLHVFTGTEPEAGTDANVYITLSGSMGSSRKISLTPENANHNPFEAGQRDDFKVHTIPLGTITGITIGHDNTGGKPADWFLQKIVVKDAANTVYKFEVNGWLAKEKDDGPLERELSPTATISPGSYKAIGCFKERTDVNKDRAIPSLEGRDDVLDGLDSTSYRGREFPIEKCADAARRRGYVMFAIQDGGLCATSKEIQNTYDIYGEADDCQRNGTGSAFSSTVYTFSDEEPGFQDAELSAGGTEEGSENGEIEAPAVASDPAMQVAEQVPSLSQGGTANTNPAALNKPELTTGAGIATSGGRGKTESTGNQGSETGGSVSNPQVTANKESAIKSVSAPSTGPDLEQASVPVASKGIDKTPERLPQTPENGFNTPDTNLSPVKGKDITRLTVHVPKAGGDTATFTSKPEGKEQNTNGNTGMPSSKANEKSPPQSAETRPGQTAERITNYPVITDAAPQEPKLHPGRVDNKIPRPESQYTNAAKAPVIEKPLIRKVHKIAPETRLPGEFTSPGNVGHRVMLKTRPVIVKSPFSKLVDARERDEIRVVQPKK